MKICSIVLALAMTPLPMTVQAGPQKPGAQMTAKVQPARAVAMLKRQLRMAARDGGRAEADIYLECYPGSGEGMEDCSMFNALCAGGGGGVGHIDGGGYSCHVVE